MRRTRERVSALAVGVLAVGVLGTSATSLGTAVASPATVAEWSPGRPAVLEHRVIGHSVRGRAIHAWRLGEPTAKVTAVAMSAMHGDELAVRRILRSLRDGAPVEGLDLWLVPTVNPDGAAYGLRKNARGVDLNRNFPRSWAPLDGNVESGPRPASEPETRALMRFLRRVDPDFVVSFHQPLHGIDVHGPKKRWFARRLAEYLRLPTREFSCGGACHGTLSQWFNHHFEGVAVTVEYGENPPLERMEVRAPRQLLRALRVR